MQVGGNYGSSNKSKKASSGLTGGLRWVRAGLSAAGETGIPGVAVECADIRKNTGGEGGSLGRYWRWGAKAWGANRISEEALKKWQKEKIETNAKYQKELEKHVK